MARKRSPPILRVYVYDGYGPHESHVISLLRLPEGLPAARRFFRWTGSRNVRAWCRDCHAWDMFPSQRLRPLARPWDSVS